MNIIDIKKEKIFDGYDKELFVKNFLMKIDDMQFTFIADDLNPYKFANFQGKNSIIEALELIENNFSIFSKDRMQAYYLQRNQYIFVFSLGEYQPARFMLIR